MKLQIISSRIFDSLKDTKKFLKDQKYKRQDEEIWINGKSKCLITVMFDGKTKYRINWIK